MEATIERLENNTTTDFVGGKWQREINVRDFIQKNYTPYNGNSDFLAEPTEATKKLWEECLELFKDRIVIFHLKDYIVKDNKLVQVGLGQGLIDYSKIIPKIMKNNPNAYLIFEGVVGDDIKSSKEYIERLVYGTK